MSSSETRLHDLQQTSQRQEQELRQALVSCQSQLLNCEQQLTACQVQLETEKRAHSQRLHQIDTDLTQLTASQAQLASLKLDYTSIQQQLSFALSERDRLSELFATTEAEHAAQLEKLRADLRQSTSECSDLREELTTLSERHKQQLADQRVSIDEQQRRLEEEEQALIKHRGDFLAQVMSPPLLDRF